MPQEAAPSSSKDRHLAGPLEAQGRAGSQHASDQLEVKAAVMAWLREQEAALASQQKQLQVLHSDLSLRQELLQSRELYGPAPALWASYCWDLTACGRLCSMPA